MNKEFIAYCVTHILDGKKYIGITSCGLPKRWAEHKADCKNPKTAFHAAMAASGIENFFIEHIASAGSWDDLLMLEQILIEQHDTFWANGNGYNMTAGGGDGSLRLLTNADWLKHGPEVIFLLRNIPRSHRQLAKLLRYKSANSIRNIESGLQAMTLTKIIYFKKYAKLVFDQVEHERKWHLRNPVSRARNNQTELAI